MVDSSVEYGSMGSDLETTTTSSTVTSSAPTSPASFVGRLEDHFTSQDAENDTPQKIADAIDKELGQFWSIKEYDDNERGPIELPKEVYPEGSKRNWAGNQVYTPAYEVSPTSKEAAKQVLAKAFKEGHTVTVVGGAYGSSPLVSTRGVIINTHHLCKVLDINTSTSVSHPKQTITVESGIPIMNVINELYKIGKVLPTTPISSN